jgi:hypothetical protein
MEVLVRWLVIIALNESSTVEKKVGRRLGEGGYWRLDISVYFIGNGDGVVIG